MKDNCGNLTVKIENAILKKLNISNEFLIFY
jgi:hypothetical protein